MNFDAKDDKLIVKVPEPESTEPEYIFDTFSREERASVKEEKLKIKEWLKNKLRLWLGIEDNYDSIEIYKKMIDILDSVQDELLDDISKLEKELSFFKSMCEVGIDVHTRSNSWAVVCMAGKNEYVKFVDLQQKDARHVLEFLRSFEQSKRLVDSPMGYADMFKW